MVKNLPLSSESPPPRKAPSSWNMQSRKGGYCDFKWRRDR